MIDMKPLLLRSMRATRFILWILLIVILAGCAGGNPRESDGDLEPQSFSSGSDEDGSIYSDFGDVLLPGDLDIDLANSFVFRAPGYSAGLISLNGRISLDSLVRFFDTNMAKDNWRQISAFKSPRTVMLFHKENRWCVISMNSGNFSTHVEIWVTPASGGPVTVKPQ
jgi:hypothetical protein